MSSSTLELKQDINALKKEINGLKTKANLLKASIKRKKHSPGLRTGKPRENTDSIVTDLESLFTRFPQLHDLFFSDHDFNETNGIGIPFKSYAEVNNYRYTESLGKSMSLTDRTPEHRSSPVRPSASRTDSLNTANLQMFSSPPLNSHLESHQVSDRPVPITTLGEQLLVENGYRFFGITIFPAVDPNDLQIDAQRGAINIENDILGVRLDLFDETALTFDDPFYIMLKRCTTKFNRQHTNPDTWKLFRHSIPNYIDIHEILNQIHSGNDVTTGLTLPDIWLFAKEIYIDLLREKCRRQYLRTLEEKGLLSQLDTDMKTRKITFEVNGIRIQAFLEEGNLVACSVLRGMYDHQMRSKWEVMLNGPLEDLEHKLKRLT